MFEIINTVGFLCYFSVSHEVYRFCKAVVNFFENGQEDSTTSLDCAEFLLESFRGSNVDKSKSVNIV